VRRFLGLAIPLAFAVLFVSLGRWQLDRHGERAAINAALEARLREPPVPFDAMPADTSARRWRRVTLDGRFRYDLEQVQAGRTNAGSPGVHLLTPLERAGNDTLVIVTRGWVYSPDAGSADLPRWREGDEVSLTGYLLPLAPEGPPAPARPAGAAAAAPPLRVVHRAVLEARLGAPVAPVLVVMTSDSAARADSVPRRLALPAVDPGPHRSYALQWFGFALIAVVGGIALYRRSIVAAGPKR
jgi:surfeit locus 1 family protein